MSRERPAEVARFRYRHEAELACGYLTDAGIPASVIAHDADQIQYGQHFGAPARILVPAQEVGRAREILTDVGIEVTADPSGSAEGSA